MRANYSAERADLYSPWKRGSYFSESSFHSEAALCAEMSRLAYCRAATGLDLEQNTIRTAVAKVGFAISDFFESTGESRTGGTHAFLAVRNGGEGRPPLAVLAFRGTDSDDPTISAMMLT
jgi:hypothetical protein